MAAGTAGQARLSGNRTRNGAKGAALLALALALGACAVTPEPLTLEERRAQVEADRARLFTDQEPVAGPISLAEAMARAIKYNLDYRQAMLEEAVQSRQLTLTSYDLLPKLAASAGLTTRDKDYLTVSRNTTTGVRSLEPSMSQDRNRATADLTLTWNILDFGVSYFQAHQQADRVLISGERRRRIINAIIQQVRASYWQAATGERLEGRIAPVLEEARKALKDSQTVEEERLRPPLESLRYQKALIEIIRQLETVQQDLAIAKAQLAALMNLPLGQTYSLQLPDGFRKTLPELSIPMERMETVALLRRPELQEERYQKRINVAEVRKAMVRMLPGISLTGGYNYDSNSFLVYNNWAEAGARLAYNLVTLASGPAAITAAEAQEEASDFRRLAVSMATLTQVHVAQQQFLRAHTTYEQTQLLESIERRINEQVQQQATASAESGLERIRAKASAINAELARDRAYADLQNAISTVYVALGLDPMPDTVESHDVKGLSMGIDRVLADWQSGRIAKELKDDTAPAAPAATSAEKAGPSKEPVS
ncbi:TolC family protein [Azospirillum canadense]|uniref:TolC family protein n=1 Tax=Azospirillum canadense TaxID=403962 RepID=UPI00222656D7|nr:TolC family protein [Azospirillum canadense]MCW2242494.1 outer membrane protein TolC [Azospirillum canadense]